LTYVAGARATGVGRGRGGSSASRASGGGARARVGSAAASLADGKISRAGAEVALDGEDLVVVRTKLHAETRPSVEVVGKGDGSGRALGAADRPELLEVAGALDRRGVGALVGVDIVGVTIRDDLTLLTRASRWVVGSKVLHDVVFDEGVPLLKTCGQCWSDPGCFNDLPSNHRQPSMSCRWAGRCRCR
jgi:hypothetical protein